MKLVAGLGNPGREYAGHRHNVGFAIVDRLTRRFHLELTQRRFEAEYGQGEMAGQKVVVLKPQTFMNLSGQAVAPAARFFKVPVEDVVVVHDELDLPLGRLQVKVGGGPGGHNGVRSILECLGNDGFVRVRVGIGKPEVAGEKRAQVVGHVLGEFSKEESEVANAALDRAAEAVVRILEKGAAVAMNEFNRR
jgi:PTH1 family peptidyl-tRNA hydrolase